MAQYAKPLSRLIGELSKLPGIGDKSAQRLAFHVLGLSDAEAQSLADSITEAKRLMKFCPVCGNLTDREICGVCGDEKRERGVICVVESPRDVAAMERTHEYRGLYHVLNGVLSPMDGIGPNEINLKSLILRLQSEDIGELILATNPNTEGEATAMYIARLVKPAGIKVTRIARGIPVGGDLEYTDSVTLMKALEGRREL